MKIRWLTAVILLFVMVIGVLAQVPDPGPPMPPWDRFKSWLYNGQMTLTYKTLTSPTITGPTFSGTLTLANGATLTNTPDGTVTVTEDDDGTTLLTVVLSSSNPAANLSDNDKILLQFKALDDSSGATVYGQVEAKLTDITDETEDSQLLFYTVSSASSTLALTLSADDVTVADDLTVGDDMEVNGDQTLENDEKIKNSTDSNVDIVFNDNTTTPAILNIITTDSLADNDVLSANFKGPDESANVVAWSSVQATVLDATANSKDSNILFKTWDTNSSVTPMTLTGNDAVLADNVEINGDITMENDDKIVNSVDANVSVIFNDDAATLGNLNVVTTDSIADNDAININYQGPDESANVVSWATIQTVITDATANSKDSNLLLKTFDANSSVTALTATGNDITFADNIEINGDQTLENDEKIKNSTDGNVDIVFDDNSATPAILNITTTDSLADNDVLSTNFKGPDEGANVVTWSSVQATVLDATANSKDSKIAFNTWEANSAKVPLSLSGSGAAFAGIMTIADGVTTGTATFDNGASADTVTVTGVTAAKSIVWATFTSDPGSPGASWTVPQNGGLIIMTCDAAVTATPTWRWFRMEIP